MRRSAEFLPGCVRTDGLSAAERIAALLAEAQRGRYSKELGIDLASRDAQAIFRWFLAAVLLGARISGSLAIRTYREFVRDGLSSPPALQQRGWDGLVAVLDRGGYVRYDYKTATKLLELAGNLQGGYGGDLNALHEAAEHPLDLERRLKALAKGIGEVTVNIFLREMRGIWSKADPLPVELVIVAAQSRGLIPAHVTDRRQALALLRSAWQQGGRRAEDFPEFETALLRLGLLERRRASRKAKAAVEGAAPKRP